jgi:diguanylate cyclase (GGDEF)-like protein/PAS domain S-box-containing protein
MKPLSHHTLKQMVRSSSEGLVLLDARHPNHPIVYVNPAYEELSGYAAQELLGSCWRLAEPADDEAPEMIELRDALERGEPCQLTVRDVRKDGETWFSRLSLIPISDACERLQYFLCQHLPIDPDATANPTVKVDLLQRELGNARQHIARLSRTDMVTGLLSFEYFKSLLRRDLGIARRERDRIAILMFDVVELDAYKRTFGANAAGSCLRMIAAQISVVFRRAGDLCARFGDTSIVVSALGLDDAQAHRMADRVIDKVRGLHVRNPHAEASKTLTVRSVVYTDVPDDDDVEQLIELVNAELDPPCAVESNGTHHG